MGFMTFAEIQNEISLNLGSRISSTKRIRRFARMGYVDLVARLKIANFREIRDFPITEFISEYSLPDEVIGVRTIEVDKRRLILAGRLPMSLTEGRPARYFLDANGITIWPIPKKNYVGRIEVIVEPGVIADNETTQIQGIWDTGIIQLGTHHALASLGDPQANMWLNKFKEYKEEHKTAWDVEQDSIRPGLQVARSWEDLRDDNDWDD